jgi:hypothetical protein
MVAIEQTVTTEGRAIKPLAANGATCKLQGLKPIRNRFMYCLILKLSNLW